MYNAIFISRSKHIQHYGFMSFHAYVVEATPTETFVKSGELLTHEPLYFRSVKGLTKANQQAVVLKHHISYD